MLFLPVDTRHMAASVDTPACADAAAARSGKDVANSFPSKLLPSALAAPPNPSSAKHLQSICERESYPGARSGMLEPAAPVDDKASAI